MKQIAGSDGRVYLRAADGKHQAGSVASTVLAGPAAPAVIGFPAEMTRTPDEPRNAVFMAATLEDCDWLSDDDIDCIAYQARVVWPDMHDARDELLLEPATLDLADLNPAALSTYLEDGDEDGYELVEELVVALEDGTTFPPLIVFPPDEDGVWWLADGCHRAAALNEFGESNVDVLIARRVEGDSAAEASVHLAEMEQLADDFVMCATDLLFDSDGVVVGETSLADMAHPDGALNNCFAASTAVWRELQEDCPEGWRALMIELGTMNTESANSGDSGVHWAVLMQNEETGDEYILDYTARQFRPDMPFPLVAPVDEWREMIMDAIQVKHGGQRTSEFVVDGPGGTIVREWMAE